jgi:hypothetical protein
VKSFANPDVPRPGRRPVPDLTRRRTVQPPLVLRVPDPPAPDPRVLDAADVLAALAAAYADPAMTPATFGVLFAMWDAADKYGVFRGGASALAGPCRTSKSRARALVRTLTVRAYAVSRGDGSYRLQTPISDRSRAPRGGAHRGGAGPAPRGGGTRTVRGRAPTPYGGGGGRAPSSRTAAPPTPRRPQPPTDQPALEAWDGPTDAGRAEIARIRNREKLL